MYFQRKLDQKIFAHLPYHWLETGQPFSSCRSAKLTRRNSSGNSWKKEPSLNFLCYLPHKGSFNGYHVFSRSNDREKTRNNMVVTRITPGQEGHRESLPPQVTRVRPRISLFKTSKTSWGMGRSRQIIHQCTILIFGLRRWIIAISPIGALAKGAKIPFHNWLSQFIQFVECLA